MPGSGRPLLVLAVVGFGFVWLPLNANGIYYHWARDEIERARIEYPGQIDAQQRFLEARGGVNAQLPYLMLIGVMVMSDARRINFADRSMTAQRRKTPAAIAALILASFRAYRDRFRAITLAAKTRFERTAWVDGQLASAERIEIYKQFIGELQERHQRAFGGRAAVAVAVARGERRTTWR